MTNSELDISVLQKYICAIQMIVVVDLLRTPNISLEENANLNSDKFG